MLELCVKWCWSPIGPGTLKVTAIHKDTWAPMKETLKPGPKNFGTTRLHQQLTDAGRCNHLFSILSIITMPTPSVPHSLSSSLSIFLTLPAVYGDNILHALVTNVNRYQTLTLSTSSLFVLSKQTAVYGDNILHALVTNVNRRRVAGPVRSSAVVL
jgi:hypothetical protein